VGMSAAADSNSDHSSSLTDKLRTSAGNMGMSAAADSNSDHSSNLTGKLRASVGVTNDAAVIAPMLSRDLIDDSVPSGSGLSGSGAEDRLGVLPARRPSSSSGSYNVRLSYTELSDNVELELQSSDDLDAAVPPGPGTRTSMPRCPSRAMLENLGDSPSAAALADVAAVRAEEYIHELPAVHRGKWDGVAEFAKEELVVGQHLGKGGFCDVFEVMATVRDMGVHDNLDRSTNTRTNTRFTLLAMKCLRPQIRSNAEKFIVGVEDLVRETAILASLEHPNIIKLHGRAGGNISDGYFILLDRLQDTLDDRIQRWKKAVFSRSPPDAVRVQTAAALADAVSYLHSKNICFRDLKPANVGFDSEGVLKLFDFGLAVGIYQLPSPSPRALELGRRARSAQIAVSSKHLYGAQWPSPAARGGGGISSGACGPVEEWSDDGRERGLLYDICGTPRYMAPEVGLEQGYALPADVYSFGILLWEICSLTKPFGKVKSAAEFHKVVFEKGARPKLPKVWSPVLRDLMTGCWSPDVADRPEMAQVRGILTAHARVLAGNCQLTTVKNSSSLRVSLSASLSERWK